MEAVVLVIHLIVALAIIGVVLLQPSESGGFLGNSGSMSNLGAPRRTGDVLTRLTAVLAGIFFITSLMLAIIAEQRAPDKSILDAVSDETPAVTKTEKAPAAALDAPKKSAETPKKEKPQAPVSK